MSDQPDFTERIHLAGENLVEQVEKLIHEGNVRKVVIKHGEKTIAEFPLTFGVVGIFLAPTLAAIGALVAVATDTSIEVERTTPEPPVDAPKD